MVKKYSLTTPVKEVSDVAATFDVYKDAAFIKKHLKGDKDIEESLKLLSIRSKEERSEIESVYLEVYKKNFTEELKKICKGDKAVLLNFLQENPETHIAELLMLKGDKFDENMISLYLLTIPPKMREKVEIAFKNKTKKSLSTELIAFFGPQVKEFITKLYQPRDPSVISDNDKANKEVLKIEASDKTTCIPIYTNLFSQESYPHISEVLISYENIHDKPLESHMKNNCPKYIVDWATKIIEIAKGSKEKFLCDSIKEQLKGGNFKPLLFAYSIDCDMKELSDAYSGDVQQFLKDDLKKGLPDFSYQIITSVINF